VVYIAETLSLGKLNAFIKKNKRFLNVYLVVYKNTAVVSHILMPLCFGYEARDE
jgi:hypothetical protein